MNQRFNSLEVVVVRQANKPEEWRSSWAVRRDWPDGSHEFVGIRRSRRAAARALAGDEAFWRRAPLVPVLTLVRISPRDFVLHGRHRRGCRAPDCPVVALDLELLIHHPYWARRWWWSRREAKARP